MAGITGIIAKNLDNNTAKFDHAIKRMVDKLSLFPSQLRDYKREDSHFFGNVMPIHSAENHCFIEDKELGAFVAIEGLVYVADDEKKMLTQKYGMPTVTHEHQWLPLMYHHYGSKMVNHLTGWYNIFIYHKATGNSVLFNDRLGYLPLFIYENDSYLLFSSKIESLLASGLMPTIAFDHATFAEHLYFNYPLSEHTYVKNISTLTNATLIDNNNGKLHWEKYWSMGSLFNQKALNEKDSFEVMNNALKDAVLKGITKKGGSINLSLTGGWDSRLVLSYLLPEYRERLNTYSFGSATSADITIPQYIANQEGLKYTPYILDDSYLGNEFLQQGTDTIMLSNGTRSYKRAHYLYAIREVCGVSDLLYTGIFGDEVLKISHFPGGEVFPKNTIDFIESDFDLQAIMDSLSKHDLFSYLNARKSEILPVLQGRLEKIKNDMDAFGTISEKYYVLRFEYNLRKYFGHEANSYNDFVNGFSPFIDNDFLEVFAQTKYLGTRFPFNSNSLLLKKQATRLYYKLTQANYPALTAYNTGRGYSMRDAATIAGQMKIIYRKFVKAKIKSLDGFNTKPTDELFAKRFLSQNTGSNSVFKKTASINSPFADKLNSLSYWVDEIVKNNY